MRSRLVRCVAALAWTGLGVVLAGCAAGDGGREAQVTVEGEATTRAPGVPEEVPGEYREAVAVALQNAGGNAGELVQAIRGVPAEQRAAVCFLIANMPEPDLRGLTASFIVEDVAWAFKARDEMAWGKTIPDEIFLNDVLPYASVNERRDNWRRGFYERFGPLVQACRTPGEAALKLNREVFPLLNVQYHATKRPKPDQSPYESIEANYASCTGLSVLLADACRAVCVPARLAGTPEWTTKEGNHTWTEVWDRQWYFLGSAEPDAAGFNHAWFVEDAAKADASDLMHRIYATSFRKTGLAFPLVWDLELKWVSACDVTKYYTGRKQVKVVVRGGASDGGSAAARLELRLRGVLWGAADFMDAAGVGERVATFELPSDEVFDAEVETVGGGKVRAVVDTAGTADPEVVVDIRRR